EATLRSRAMCQEFGGRDASGFADALQRPVEGNEVRGVDIGGQPGRVALEDFALGIDRDVKNREDLPTEERLPRLGERIRAPGPLDCLMRVERLDEATAELAVIMVDDGDRRVAQQLAEIGLRVEDAIEQRRQHEE